MSPMDTLADALAESGRLPGAWWAGVARAPWREYARARAEAILRGAQLVASQAGAGAWRPLPWDSALLGVQMGRIDAVVGSDLPSAYAAVRDAAASADVQHLSARVDAAALEDIWALERAGFRLMDGLLTFSAPIATEPASVPDGFRVRITEPRESDAIASLADFTHDRFHADPHLDPRRVDDLHRTWVRNSVTREVADVVWVAEDDQGVLAYTTGRVDPVLARSLGVRVLVIGLVGTVARGRRHGLARALSQEARYWAHAEGLDGVEVGTQLRNVPAARTYQGAGYRLAATSLTFHWWGGQRDA